MKQQKTDGDKTLAEMQLHRNPTVWEVGKKYDPETDSFVDVNGRPNFKKQKETAK